MNLNGRRALSGAAALALTCSLAACGGPGDSAPPAQDAVKIPNVTVAIVEPREMADRALLPALVHPGLQAVVSAEVGGVLENLPVDKGDPVEKGQLLAEIDRAEIEAAVRQAEALAKQAHLAADEAELEVRRTETAAANAERALEQARFGLELATRAREKAGINLENQRRHSGRIEKLYQERLASQSAHDDATSLVRTLEADLEAAQAGVEQATRAIAIAEGQLKTARIQEESARLRIDSAAAQAAAQEAALEQARIQRRKSRMTAPFDGHVDNVFFEEGEFVKIESPVLAVIQTDTVEVHLSLPEKDMPFIGEGQQAIVTIASLPGRVFGGTVSFVALSSDTRTNTFPVEITVPNHDGTLKPGMVANVTLVRARVPDAIAVPNFAVVTKEEGKVVFVLEGDQAVMRPVRLGIVESGLVQILDGLSAGDQLIVKGQRDLQDGQQVRVIR